MLQGLEVTKSDKMLVAVGGNADSPAGNPLNTVKAGLGALARLFGRMTQSQLYRTPAFPAGAGPDFVNAACVFESARSPEEIMAELHRIEAEFERERDARWGQRTLDLDLIACGGAILPDEQTQTAWRNLPMSAQQTDTPDQLILPHPRLQDRPFVLVPLMDVAPDWVHPVLGLSIAEMHDALSTSERAEIKAIPPE